MSKNKEVVKSIWKYRGIEVEFSDPMITPFYDNGGETPRDINSIEDAMYFYYDIIVRVEDRKGGCTEVFREMAHDFPNVQFISKAVHELIARKGHIVLENHKEDDFSREVKYNYRTLEGIVDPRIKIERYDCRVRQEHYDGEIRKEKSTYYALSITKPFRGCDSSQREGLFLEGIGKRHLLRLAKVSEEFCRKAVDYYNGVAREVKEDKCRAER